MNRLCWIAMVLISQICNADDRQARIDAAISSAERICLVGKRYKFSLNVNGQLTIAKVLPGATALVNVDNAQAPGGVLFENEEIRKLVDEDIRRCMQQEWPNVLKAYDTANALKNARPDRYAVWNHDAPTRYLPPLSRCTCLETEIKVEDTWQRTEARGLIYIGVPKRITSHCPSTAQVFWSFDTVEHSARTVPAGLPAPGRSFTTLELNDGDSIVVDTTGAVSEHAQTLICPRDYQFSF